MLMVNLILVNDDNNGYDNLDDGNDDGNDDGDDDFDDMSRALMTNLILNDLAATIVLGSLPLQPSMIIMIFVILDSAD